MFNTNKILCLFPIEYKQKVEETTINRLSKTYKIDYFRLSNSGTSDSESDSESSNESDSDSDDSADSSDESSKNNDIVNDKKVNLNKLRYTLTKHA